MSSPSASAPMPLASPYRRVLAIWPQGMSAGTFLILAMMAYALAHAGLRLAFSDVIAVDWVGETVFSQTLDWGHTPKYPPLPAWALWLVHHVTGPGALATLLVKYSVLVAAFGAYFLAARRVLADGGWALLATLSLLLLYQIGWNIHEGVTHTVFLILAAPLTLLAVLRLMEAPGLWRYVQFGVVIALGALAKQAYFAGLGALVLAMAMQPGYRRLLVNPRILATVAAALALAGPHYLWALTSGFDFAGAASDTLGVGEGTDRAAQIASGLVSVVTAPLLFLSPLLPILVVLAPRAFAPRNLVHPGAHGTAEADPVRLVRDALLAALAILAVPVLVAGVAHYGERWMHPLMLLAPIYLIALIRAAHVPTIRIRTLWWIIAGVSLAVLVWRAAGFIHPSPVTCGKCRLDVPYAALAGDLAEAGFADGTILAGDEHIAGNLRAHFPDARVVALPYGFYDPPPASSGRAGQCMIVWRAAGDGQAPSVPPAALSYLGLAALPARTRLIVLDEPHHRALGSDGGRISHFAAVLMPATGRCR